MTNGIALRDIIEAAVHDLYQWRGTIVGGLAQFESTLLDACIQIDKLPEYAGSLAEYPEKPAAAIAYIEGLLAKSGSLSIHATNLSALFREYETLSLDRNLFAHGIMKLQHSGGQALSLEITLWHRKPRAQGKGATRRTEQFLWAEVKSYAEQVADLADRAMARFNMMYQLHAFGGATDYTP